MIRFPLLVIIVVLWPVLLWAQRSNCAKSCTCVITGKIQDAETHEPIPFATIQIKDTEKGTLADGAGNFTIDKMCDLEADLVISHIGYQTLTHHHDIYHDHMIVQLAPDNLILEGVVVEGKAEKSGLTTSSISHIEGKELDLVKNESLGEALSSITGVSTLKTGQNVIKPIIHGLHSNRILIINNGIRHENQEWGQEHAPEIDPSLAENISVIKSAAAVKYGPNALGGVIIIDPPKLELSSHLHGEVSVQGESNGRAMDSHISLQKGYGRFAWLAQASGRYQGDLQTADYNLTNTGAREQNYALGAKYHLQKLDVQVYYSHLKQELGILRGSVVGNLDDLAIALEADEPAFTRSFSYEINTPRQETAHDLLKVESTYNWDESQLKFQYAYQVNKRKEFDVRRGINNDRPSIDLELFTHSIDVEWLHPEFNGWNGSIGTQWLYQDNNNLPGTHTISFIPNYTNMRYGLYLIESKAIGNHATFEFGGRYDHQSASIIGRDTDNSIYSSEFNYESVSAILGIKRNFGAYTNISSNIATAWRPPNIAELYSFGKHEYAFNYGMYRYSLDSNGEIKTDIYSEKDKSIGNEVGFKWITDYAYKKDNLRAEISPYLNFIKDFIFRRPYGITQTVRGPLPYFIYQQTDALLLGVDATVFYTHNDNFQSKLSASYLKAKDVKNDQYLFGIPANRFSYKISYNRKHWLSDNFSFAIETSYTLKQNDAPRVITVQELINAKSNEINLFEEDNSIFDFKESPGDYILINLNTNVTFNNFIVGLKISNLLNRGYRDYTDMMRYFADEQGINCILSVKMKL